MKNIIEEAQELFGKMRDATPEKQKCIDNHLKDISIPTGLNFCDFFKRGEWK